MSFVAAARPWRDVLWALLGICGGLWIILIFGSRETRHTTILQARAKREIKKKSELKNDPRYHKILQQQSVKELFKIALGRPFRFLFTEAIIVFGALYNGYLYGISYLFNGAFT